MNRRLSELGQFADKHRVRHAHDTGSQHAGVNFCWRVSTRGPSLTHSANAAPSDVVLTPLRIDLRQRRSPFASTIYKAAESASTQTQTKFALRTECTCRQLQQRSFARSWNSCGCLLALEPGRARNPWIGSTDQIAITHAQVHEKSAVRIANNHRQFASQHSMPSLSIGRTHAARSAPERRAGNLIHSPDDDHHQGSDYRAGANHLRDRQFAVRTERTGRDTETDEDRSTAQALFARIICHTVTRMLSSHCELNVPTGNRQSAKADDGRHRTAWR